MSEHDKAVAEIADFESWWRKNHPFDWWASERGEPLDSYTRLLVWDKCKDAWEAAINEALGRVVPARNPVAGDSYIFDGVKWIHMLHCPESMLFLLKENERLRDAAIDKATNG